MNTIFIGQTQDQTRFAAELIQNSNLQQIRLVRSKLELAESVTGQPAPLSVTFSFAASKQPSPAGTLRLKVAFQMAGVPENPVGEASAPPSGDPAVEVDCAFRLDYELRPGFEPADAQIEAFKDGNAIFNAWPYFREYLQSTLQRMGLPPFTLPFLRLHPASAPNQSACPLTPSTPATPRPVRSKRTAKQPSASRRA